MKNIVQIETSHSKNIFLSSYTSNDLEINVPCERNFPFRFCQMKRPILIRKFQDLISKKKNNGNTKDQRSNLPVFNFRSPPESFLFLLFHTFNGFISKRTQWQINVNS